MSVYRTIGPLVKLGMKHQREELYKVFINHDPRMTLTYFTARSTKVAHAFEWGKIVKMSFEGKKLEGNDRYVVQISICTRRSLND